jgi:23S rRNA pseudouridine1911/1915/1917 synthase
VTVQEEELTFAGEKPAPLPEDIALDVLYEDEYLLGINKPAGLVVQPGSGNRTGTLVNALLHSFPGLSEGYESDRPGIVHRLDKDTSGVLIVARNNAVHAAMGTQFANRTVEKTYSGICIGRMPEETGRIEAPLGRSRSDPLKRAVMRQGKPSLTEFRLAAYQSGISLVEFILHTGRTHQIRVHAAHAGFPILADETYGGGRERILRLPPLERPFAFRVLKCFDRHALHARTLAFTHPVTNQRMEITAPYPSDFAEALGHLPKG